MCVFVCAILRFARSFIVAVVVVVVVVVVAIVDDATIAGSTKSILSPLVFYECFSFRIVFSPSSSSSLPFCTVTVCESVFFFFFFPPLQVSIQQRHCSNHYVPEEIVFELMSHTNGAVGRDTQPS